MARHTNTARERVSRALIKQMRDDIVFAAIMCRHAIVEDESVGTMCINGVECRYNPKFVETRTDDGLQRVLDHEACHILLGHHLRAEPLRAIAMLEAGEQGAQRMWDNWQSATDCAVNELLLDKKGFPDDATTADKLSLPRDLAAEAYQHLLKERQDEEDQDEEGDETATQSPSDPSNDEDSPAGDSGDSSSESDDESDSDPSEDGDGDGSGEGSDGEQQEEGTSSSEGGDSEGEPDAVDNSKPAPSSSMGDVAPHPESTGDEASDRMLERQWETMIASAVMQAKACGKLEGWMEELVDTMLTPAQIPWQQKLRRFARKFVKMGVSYTRPNRLHSSRRDGVLLPSRGSYAMDRGVFIVDTSGSMSANECNAVLGELKSVLKSFRSSVLTVLQCDTRVTDEREFKGRDRFDIKDWSLKGRKGTHMHPAFDRAMELKPQFIVCLTDGYMSWPEPTKVPVMWLITNDTQIPPHGDHSVITVD